MSEQSAFQKRLVALANSPIETANEEFLVAAVAARGGDIDDKEIERLNTWFTTFMLTVAAIANVFDGHMRIHFRVGATTPTWQLSEAGVRHVETMGKRGPEPCQPS